MFSVRLSESLLYARVMKKKCIGKLFFFQKRVIKEEEEKSRMWKRIKEEVRFKKGEIRELHSRFI